MLIAFADDFSANLSETVMVSNSTHDMFPARAAGTIAVPVGTG